MVYTVKIQPHPDDVNRYTEEKTYRQNQLDASKLLNWISAAGAVIALLALIALSIYACITHRQLGAMLDSNKLTQQSLNVSQRAYVTIGRKDGVVADFVVPKDPKQSAEIVIYFQNSGHLPAKFAWGTMLGFGEAGGVKQYTGINYTHPYKGGFTRTRDKKTGSINEKGDSAIIAGDSVFVSTLGEISQKDLAELPASHMGLFVFGRFEYCDELGNSSTQEFGLRYRGNAPSTSLSFDLAANFAFPISPLPESSTTTEYLPPCETFAEREKNKKAN